jgi:transposase
LCSLPAVEALRQVWVQQYYTLDETVHWRTDQQGLPALSRFINSPYDVEARYARKRSTSWVGYKVHLTETCEDDQPHLIAHVETVLAPSADGAVTQSIHEGLKANRLLPNRHLVDAGYMDAPELVTSQQAYNVELVGPARADYKWQARAALPPF